MSKENKGYWSEGGQIFFRGGYAWGINGQFQRIRLGTESAILKALEQNIKATSPAVNEILVDELKCRKE